MKDTELRGILLQQFYEHRRERRKLGIDVAGTLKPALPQGIDDIEAARICDQLRDSGLIEWKSMLEHSGGRSIAGCGGISSFGVDVMEREARSPIPIHIVDQSRHEQTINVSGTQGGVQVGGAHSSFEQTITQDIEKPIAAINGSTVANEAKEEAKSKLAAFLGSSAVESIFDAGVKVLIESCAK